MLLGGLTMHDFDNISSNSTHDSCPNEESNDSNDDFSANKQKKAQNLVFHVPMAPEEAFEQGHMIT